MLSLDRKCVDGFQWTGVVLMHSEPLTRLG